MGKTNWKRLGLGFLAAACVLGSSIGSAHAGSTTVNIRIPAQPVGGTPPPPISVVRMTFETTGISGTTTISVTRNGVSTNVASIPIPSIVPQPIYTGGPSNEDTLSVKLTGGILELKLFPKSRQGGTQCIPDSTTAAQNGDYAITFTDSAGTPAVTSFRLTSYSAPTGAGTTNCSCNSRRRASYAALWNPLPPGTNKGRHPMNVSLVLDHSGSMSSSTNGDPNPAHRRWDTLSWSVEQFVKDWAVVGGVPDVGGTNLEEDALSVVFFDSSVIPSTGAGATWTARGSATSWNNTSHPWHTIVDAVTGQGPNAATSIGGALQVALDSFQSLSGFDKTIILMTDGIQNTVPCVRVDGSGKVVIDGTGGCPGMANGNVIKNVADECARVITIGMGDSNVGSLEEGLLDLLAQQTDGQSHLVSKETDTGFAGALVEALKGNTVSLAKRQVETIDPGTGKVTDVALDSTVRSATFVLAWAEGGSEALNLAIADPSGKQVKPAASARDGRRMMHYIIERVDLGKTGPAGTWKAAVVRAPVIEGPKPEISYHLSIYTEEQSLEFRLGFQGDKHGTGQRLVLANDIAFDDAVLAGAAGQISVEVETPAGALGTMLRDAQGGGSAGTGPDPVTAYRQKADQVLSDPENLKKAGTKSGGTLVVTEPSPGHYEVALDPSQTTLPGTYRFHVTLDLPGKNGERVKRAEHIETQVQVLPDPATTDLTVNNGEVAGSVDLVIVPRDRFGNYVGPGYNNWFNVTIVGPGSARGIDDNSLTGTYVAHLNGINPLLSTITVSLGGNDFLRGTVTDFRAGRKFAKGGGGGHCIAGCCCNLGGSQHDGATAAVVVAALLALVLLRRRGARR